LRAWFAIHGWVDLAFAVPLFAAPRWFLGLLGWDTVDPVASRMVAAALAGIGIESWRMRRGGVPEFRAMLDLKLIWSGVAIAGLAVSLAGGAPPVAWGLLAVFAGFAARWASYRRRLGV
jgi:hypothetical protein